MNGKNQGYKMKKVLVFDFYAPLGHFRMPYTTTSPLTFPIPSKTSIYGLVGAIIGLDKNDYLNYFQDETTKIAISVNKKINKITIAQNLINTKNVTMFARMDSRKQAPRTQIRIEFLKNISYRIYINFETEELHSRLKSMLSFHKTKYSISMGLSECLANYNYIGEFDLIKVKDNNNFIELNSILPINLLENNSQIKLLECNKKFLRVHLPLEMKPDRELIKSGDFIVEESAKTIFTSIESYFRIEELEQNIILF